MNSPGSRVATLTALSRNTLPSASVGLTKTSTLPDLMRKTSSVARAPCRMSKSPAAYRLSGSFMPFVTSRSLDLMRSGAGRTVSTVFNQGWFNADAADKRCVGLNAKQLMTNSRPDMLTESHSKQSKPKSFSVTRPYFSALFHKLLGIAPVSKTYAMTPSDHMSMAAPYDRCSTTSGAANTGVPTGAVSTPRACGNVPAPVVFSQRLANPKSAITTLAKSSFERSNKFSSFKSRCSTKFLCM
mmetsp:Transcript_1919/g.7163  ORF Transcript_1919/g.7163 Transcript_1919/m.7163 type:complete len:242 (+) Transcript_1919:1016-1741(+)